jgi:hypothetical protein
MVAARRRLVATHAPVGAIPAALFLFFCAECDDGSAAEVIDLSEMMAAMPPRPKGLFYLCIFLICIFFLFAET